MPKGLIEQSTLTNIANAIRTKLGSSDTILPSEMAGLIEGISGGGGTLLTGQVNHNVSYYNNKLYLGAVIPAASNFILIVWAEDASLLETHAISELFLINFNEEVSLGRASKFSSKDYSGTTLATISVTPSGFTFDHASGVVTSPMNKNSYSFDSASTYYNWIYYAM